MFWSGYIGFKSHFLVDTWQVKLVWGAAAGDSASRFQCCFSVACKVFVLCVFHTVSRDGHPAVPVLIDSFQLSRASISEHLFIIAVGLLVHEPHKNSWPYIMSLGTDFFNTIDCGARLNNLCFNNINNCFLQNILWCILIGHINLDPNQGFSRVFGTKITIFFNKME